MSSRAELAAEAVVAALGDAEYVLLGIPDVHGSIRGKALRPDAFAAALREGTVMTDLLLALDPTDTPITDYESFGIRFVDRADLVEQLIGVAQQRCRES